MDIGANDDLIKASENALHLDRLTAEDKVEERFIELCRIYSTVPVEPSILKPTVPITSTLVRAKVILLMESSEILQWYTTALIIQNPNPDDFNIMTVFPLWIIRQKLSIEVLMNHQFQCKIISLPSGDKTKKVDIPSDIWVMLSHDDNGKIANYLVVETLHRLHPVFAV